MSNTNRYHLFYVYCVQGTLRGMLYLISSFSSHYADVKGVSVQRNTVSGPWLKIEA